MFISTGKTYKFIKLDLCLFQTVEHIKSPIQYTVIVSYLNLPSKFATFVEIVMQLHLRSLDQFLITFKPTRSYNG